MKEHKYHIVIDGLKYGLSNDKSKELAYKIAGCLESYFMNKTKKFESYHVNEALTGNDDYSYRKVYMIDVICTKRDKDKIKNYTDMLNEYCLIDIL